MSHNRLVSCDLLQSVVVIVSFLLGFVKVVPHVSNDGTNLAH